MKIKVARYVRIYFYLSIILGVISFIWFITVLWPFEFFTITETLLNVWCMLFFFALPVFYLLVCPRAFIIIKIQGERIISSLFGKEKCTVNMDKEVYYAIIQANPEKLRGAIAEFIVVSNKPFSYVESEKIGVGVWKREKLFENYYDMTQMILIPYNQKTKHIFPIARWSNCIN